MIAAASTDGTIRVWNESYQCLGILRGHKESVETLAWAPDSTKFVSGSKDKQIKFWDPVACECKHTINTDQPVSALAWSSNGTSIAAVLGNKTVKIYNVYSLKCVETFDQGKSPLKSLAWSYDNSKLAAGGNGEITVWDMVKSKEIGTL
mmetsp:Transcript_15294/g.12980  ORF Transcript_15294/g.12980 Transcript_15294/m.12980 type:complete len:149 (-) Transcript_15294:464-910(-)